MSVKEAPAIAAMLHTHTRQTVIANGIYIQTLRDFLTSMYIHTNTSMFLVLE